MADENKVTLTFDVDSKDLIDALGSIQNSTKKAVQGAEKELSGFQKFGENFATGFQASFGFFAAGALIDGVKKFGETLKDAIGEAAASDQGIRNLAAAFAETGELSENAIESVKGFADEIQRSTTFTDDAVVAGVALAKSFNITNEQAQELTKAAVDLAARTGQDLNSAVETLGKTYSGSTGLLAKQIPALKGLTEEQLKNGEAIKIVGDQYAGFAKNVASGTFSGALTQAKNQFGEILESLGKVITQNPVVVKALNLAAEAFNKISKYIEANQETLAEYISTAVKFGATLIPIFIKFGSFVLFIFGEVADAISSLIKGFIFFGNSVELIVKVASLPFREFLNAVVLVYSELIASTAGFIKAIPGAETALGKLGFSLSGLQKSAKEFSNEAGKNLKDNLTDIKDSVLNLDKGTNNLATRGLDSLAKGAKGFSVSLNDVADSADKSIESLFAINKNVGSLTDGLKNSSKSAKDFGKSAKDALDEVKGSFDKLKSANEALTKQIEKQTLTAEEQANAELKRAGELAKKALKELELTGKLTKENKALVEQYRAQAKTVRDLFEVEQAREKVKGSFDALKKASEEITKEYEKQTLTVAEIAQKEYERAVQLAANATADLALNNKLTEQNQKLIDLYVEQAKKQRDLAEIEVLREKFKGSFEKIKTLNEELTKEYEKQESTQKELIDAEYTRSTTAAANAKIELGLLNKLTPENEKLIDQYSELAYKKHQIALENLSLGDFTVGEFVNALEKQSGAISSAVAKAFTDEGGFSTFTKSIKDSFGAGVESLQKKLKKVTLGDIASGIADTLEKSAYVISGIISGGFLKTGLDIVQQFLEFPQNLLKIFEEGAALFSKLADELPGIINAIVAKLPELAGKLGNSIGSAVVSLADGLPNLVESIVQSLVPLISNLFERAIPALIRAIPKIIKALAAALPVLIDIILKALPDIITEIFKAIPQIVKALADALPAIVETLAENAPKIVLALVEGLVAAAPEIITALVDSLLINGGLERIIKALIIATPRIAIALVQGIVRGLATAALSLGQLIGRAFVAIIANVGSKIGSDFVAKIGPAFSNAFASLGRVITTSFGTAIAAIPGAILSGFYAAFGALYSTIVNAFTSVLGGIYSTIVNGAYALSQSILQAAHDFGSIVYQNITNAGTNIRNALFEPVNRLIDFLSNFSFPEPGGVLGGIAGGLGKIAKGDVVGGLSDVGGSITGGRFAEGGLVPPGFPNDSFVGRMSSGELTIPPGDTGRLSNFLDKQESGGGSDAVTGALLAQILAKLSEPISVSTTAEVNGRAFADIMLALSRNNARLSA